jgi:hypothetical protein
MGGGALKRLLAVFLVLVWIGWYGVGCAPKAASGPKKTVCVCFLNEHPCESSRRLEAWTNDALEAAFPQDIQTGGLVFKSVNYDRPENAHFFKDYALPFQSIVLQDGNNPKHWKRLDKLWEYIGDQKVFRDYVQDQTKTFLSEGR